jgi:phage N-6-adenine-methyltransferase
MPLVGFKAKNHPQQVHYCGSQRHVDDRALPAAEFTKLQARFGFTIDAAAAAHNAKLPRYYSIENSGLEASWAGERVYCNPPFSDIAPWVAKAWAEESAPLIVLLLPANRTEQNWWQNLIECRRDRAGSPLRVEFQPGRWRFLKAGQLAIGPNERPPFGCVLCIWDRSGHRATP